MKPERTRDEEEYKIFDIRLGFFCDYFIFLLEYDFTLGTENCIHFMYMHASV